MAVLRGLAAAALLARAAAAAPAACPAGMLEVGATPDGEWTVCERTLSPDPLTGALVPAGSVHYLHANGSVAVFPKSSEAMYGCNGRTENATAGCFLGMGTGSAGVHACQAGCQAALLKSLGSADVTEAQVKQLFPAMVNDGGWDERDPAHQGSWHGRPDQSEPSFNAHTYVGSRGATADAVFDSLGGDVNSQGMPSMNQFPETKYHRSDAVFKDKLSPFEQREGLWGGYLPVISLQFKLAEGGGSNGPGPAHCSSTPQKCPAHPGRTFCPSNPAPNQCDNAPAPCPPCPPPPHTHCTPPAKPCHDHPHNCCKAGSDGAAETPVGTGWIEFVACPVADMKGNYFQDVFCERRKPSSRSAWAADCCRDSDSTVSANSPHQQVQRNRRDRRRAVLRHILVPLRRDESAGHGL